MTQEPVCSRTVTINLESGLHLRPISQIAETARRFDGDVWIRKADAKVDAKSVLDLMTLNAQFGASVTLEASGNGAAELIDELAQLFDRNFDVGNDVEDT